MKHFDFTRFAAMAFGLFALVAAIAAVPVALERTGNIAAVSALFGMIAVSAVAGALLLPGRATIAMLRWTAIHTGTGPLITACALVMPIPMIVNLLSGLVPYWLGLSVTGCFLAGFVFPGLAFRGVIATPSSALSMEELGAWARPLIHRNKWAKRGYLAAVTMLVVPFIIFIFAPQVVLSSTYRPLSQWLALGLGLGVAGIFALPFFWVVPAASRPSTLPGLITFTIVTALAVTYGYSRMLSRSVPAFAAKIGGSEVVLSYPILIVDPKSSGRWCFSSVHIDTDGGPVKLCIFSRDKFEALTQSETLQITGKSTWMGQVVSVIDVPG